MSRLRHYQLRQLTFKSSVCFGCTAINRTANSIGIEAMVVASLKTVGGVSIPGKLLKQNAHGANILSDISPQNRGTIIK